MRADTPEPFHGGFVERELRRNFAQIKDEGGEEWGVSVGIFREKFAEFPASDEGKR